MSDNEEDRSSEPLDWDEDFKKSIEGIPPNAKYGAASESIRHTIPENHACAMFCKGKNCKYDNVHNWKKEQMEIDGLYSNWITRNILAMARPNTPNIQKYNIMDQFKEHGIKSIINLQLPGEHSTCGPPLEPGGFSYSQQDFMDNDIFFYNFGWQDYGVGSLSNILDMVKVMQFALSEGKVAVHCHAGLGRTGVLIACYLVYANRMDPWEVVHYIRSKRPPSVQTRSQIICIEEFSRYLVPLRVVFSTPKAKTYDFTLMQFITRQKHMLHGYEARKLKYVPKVLYECCERLLKLAGHGHKHRNYHDKLNDILRSAPSALNNRTTPYKHYDHSQSEPNGTLKKKSISMESFTPLKHVKSSQSLSLSYSSDTDRSMTPEPDGGQKSRSKKKIADTQADRTSSDSLTSHSSLDSRDSHMSMAGNHGMLNGQPMEERVAIAMARTEYDDETKAAIEQLKDALNDSFSGWKQIQKSKNPEVIVGLMWDWLDHLKEPILNAQDLPLMLEYTNSPREGLKQLTKGAEQTVLYLFRSITHLGTLSDDTERSLVQRILSTLTHQNMVVEMDALLSNKSIIRRTSNNTGLMRTSVASKMMYFFMHLIALLQDEKDENAKKDQEAEISYRDSKNKQHKEKKSNKMGQDRRRSLSAEDLETIAARKSLEMNPETLAEYREEIEDDDNGEVTTVKKATAKKKQPLGRRLAPLKA